MTRRFRLYIDSSVWDRLGDRVNLDLRRASYRFLHRSCLRQELLISPLVIEEVRSTPELSERSTIERRMRATRPVVVSGQDRATALARALQETGGFGPRMLADLTHVAYAVMGAADALVTWDRRTLARAAVRTAVHAHCRKEGLEAPLIGVPEEVARWLGLKI